MILTGLGAAPFERLEVDVLIEGNGRSGREVGNAGDEFVRWWSGRGVALAARGEEMEGLDEIGAYERACIVMVAVGETSVRRREQEGERET